MISLICQAHDTGFAENVMTRVFLGERKLLERVCSHSSQCLNAEGPIHEEAKIATGKSEEAARSPPPMPCQQGYQDKEQMEGYEPKYPWFLQAEIFSACISPDASRQVRSKAKHVIVTFQSTAAAKAWRDSHTPWFALASLNLFLTSANTAFTASAMPLMPSIGVEIQR